MTTKKADKTTFFCEGVHTGRNLQICMRDGVNISQRVYNQKNGACALGCTKKFIIQPHPPDYIMQF